MWKLGVHKLLIAKIVLQGHYIATTMHLLVSGEWCFSKPCKGFFIRVLGEEQWSSWLSASSTLQCLLWTMSVGSALLWIMILKQIKLLKLKLILLTGVLFTLLGLENWNMVFGVVKAGAGLLNPCWFNLSRWEWCPGYGKFVLMKGVVPSSLKELSIKHKVL